MESHMPDMLVRLYDLPDLEPALARTASAGITVRPAQDAKKAQVLDWATKHFAVWVPEIEVTFRRKPISCLLAVRADEILGFAAYDATCRNFFGPTGVIAEERGKGIGRALLIAALHAQRAQGYAYAIIGGVGPAEYYSKVVDAQLIAKSTPGIYAAAIRSTFTPR
jgi:GNAT superfamily N-acetyltransferase